MTTVSIDAFATLVPMDNGLCVLTTLRADGTAPSTVVNAGVLPHPVTGESVVGLVATIGHKVRNLRAEPRCTIVARAGWQWTTVEGTAELLGPDDPHPALADDGAGVLPGLLRAVFQAAGGQHDDWATYDRIMADERRVVVLITPTRVYTNP